MNFDEAQVIAAVAAIFGTTHKGVLVGIGDDGAVVETSHKSLVTTDMAVEGTHFNTGWSGAFEIGRKITAANCADIFAMGGTPQYLVVALALTGNESMEWIEELAGGIAHEAKSVGAVVVGGDLARGHSKVISMTAFGSVKHPILRSGAKPGDRIYCSSLPGWSAAGYLLLNSASTLESDASQYARDEFCAPTLDYSVAQDWISAKANSMCDVSDALVIQSQQVSKDSSVKFVFDKDKFANHPEFNQMAELADALEADPWQWIFSGGEDHVFLATGKDLGGFEVGRVEAGSGVEGLEMKKAPDTWRHFN
jgi:thiamine-monophosphate kinase